MRYRVYPSKDLVRSLPPQDNRYIVLRKFRYTILRKYSGGGHRFIKVPNYPVEYPLEIPRCRIRDHMIRITISGCLLRPVLIIIYPAFGKSRSKGCHLLFQHPGRKTRNSGGIDTAAQMSAKRHITAQLEPYRIFQQRAQFFSKIAFTSGKIIIRRNIPVLVNLRLTIF